MKQPAAKQIAAQIKRNNAKFKKASQAKKRVLIARDVIARIASGQYLPERGAWIDGALTSVAYDGDGQMQPFILQGEKCDVCALGGVFVSCTALNNRQSTAEFCQRMDRIGDSIVDGDAFSNGLTEIFEPAQLCLIETAFELGGGFGWAVNGMDDLPDDSERMDAMRFGDRFSGDRERLLAIMRNIVKNKGTFRP